MVDGIVIRRYDCPLCPYSVYASRPVQCPECGNASAEAMKDAGKVGVVGIEVFD